MLKSGESKYEINTSLPLARVRLLKSDVHDFSPSFLPFVGLSWRTGRGRTLELPPHLLFLLLSFRCEGSLFWLGFWCTQSACPSLSCWIMKRCSSLFLNLKNMSSCPTQKRISPFPTSILALQTLGIIFTLAPDRIGIARSV